MAYPDLLSLEPHLQTAKGLVVDLDGTLMSGGQFYPDAKLFLTSLDVPFMILSNDSEHTATELVQTFERHGIPLDTSQFLLAGVALIEEFARQNPGARVIMLASPALRALATNMGLVLTDERPTAILVMRDPDFSYQRLAAAVRAVHQGARLIVACPDVSHPDPFGVPIPEAGALAAAILACTGIVDYRVFGKPEPTLFNMASQRLGIQPTSCAMVGDNPDTDGLGAHRSGMLFFHISRPERRHLDRLT